MNFKYFDFLNITFLSFIILCSHQMLSPIFFHRIVSILQHDSCSFFTKHLMLFQKSTILLPRLATNSFFLKALSMKIHPYCSTPKRDVRPLISAWGWPSSREDIRVIHPPFFKSLGADSQDQAWILKNKQEAKRRKMEPPTSSSGKPKPRISLPVNSSLLNPYFLFSARLLSMRDVHTSFVTPVQECLTLLFLLAFSSAPV